MSELSDDVFSALMDERAPGRNDQYEEQPSEPEATEPAAEQERETEQVREPEHARTVEVPDKFAGKTVEEVVAAYTQLESKLGEQGHEIGRLRALEAEIANANQRAQPSPAAETDAFEWVQAKLYEDPMQALQLADQLPPIQRAQILDELKAVDPDVYVAYQLAAQQQQANQPPGLGFDPAEVESAYHAATQFDPRYQSPQVQQQASMLLTDPVQGPVWKKTFEAADSVEAKANVLGALLHTAYETGSAELATATERTAGEIQQRNTAAKVAATVATGSSAGDYSVGAQGEKERLKAAFLAPEQTNIRAELNRNRLKAR